MPVTKKSSIKKPRPRKIVSSKSVAVKSKPDKSEPKTVAKKKPEKKSSVTKAPKKQPTKNTSSSASKKPKKAPSTYQTASKQPPKSAQGTVKVPNNVPLRSIEKAEVLRSELSLYWQKSMYRVAIVSGFCFLLIGSTLASATVFGGSFAVNNNALVSTAVTEPVLTKLTMQSSVPSILNEPSKVLFTLTNVHSQTVEYYLLNETTQKTTQRQSVKNLQDTKYSFSISPEDIQSGQYKLYIQYTEKNLLNQTHASKKIEMVAKFSVPEKVTVSAVAQPASSVPDEPNTTDSDSITTTAPEAVSDTTGSSTREVMSEVSPESTTEIAVKQETSTEKQIVKQFSLYTKDTTVSDVLSINIIQATDFRNLDLYARPVTSLNSRFLTRASERSGTRVFIVNTATFLPNGTYEFYARGIDVTGKERTTPSLLITVKNTTVPAPVTTADNVRQPVKSVEEPVVTDDLNPNETVREVRNFAPVDLDARKEDEALQNDVQKASEQLFMQNSEKITELLNNYASARQSDDAIVIKTARAALTDLRVELENTALVDKKLTGIADDVILEMSQKLADLQNKVDTFEQIRKERSGGQSAIDTDNDGIPDYDEVNLYRTDPNEPDTDGDGFADGIEIVRGFDPLDDTAEAVIEFESPRATVGLIQTDILVVEEVIPVIHSITETQDTSVRTEIRGRGLPNSFVTLYIFSTPTIVTIKTDADGSFVYTLENELEDGAHEVFVAMTDNTGSIVAQSNPFSFIKEAQAFTPVDATGGDVIGGDTAVQSSVSNSYNAVIGVGVLAFGLILIMLGLSLRTKEDEHILASGRLVNEDLADSAAKSAPAKMTT